jgi:hypothetical protein
MSIEANTLWDDMRLLGWDGSVWNAYVALNSEGTQDGIHMAVHVMRQAETRRYMPNGHMAEGVRKV